MSHFYYKSLRNTNLAFLDIFNNIQIAKYDRSGNVLSLHTVPVKWAPKEKSYMWAKDQKHEKATPLIAVQLISVEPDPSRITGKTQEIYSSINSGTNSYKAHMLPSPYVLDYQVTIIANYTVEADQILEAIFASFNPYIFIRTKVTEYDEEAYDLKVILTSATPDLNIPMAEDEYRWTVWNLTFTIHGYFFKPLLGDGEDGSSSGVINSIIRMYWLDEDAFDSREMETTFTSGASGTYSYSARQLFEGYDEDAAMMIKYEIFD